MHRLCVQSTDCIVFASWILYLTVRDVNVLHADLLSVVGGGGAGERQQQHVDDPAVGLTCAGGNPRLVVVSHLETEGVRGGAKGKVKQGRDNLEDAKEQNR